MSTWVRKPLVFRASVSVQTREDEKGRTVEEERFVFIIQGRSGFQLGSVGCSDGRGLLDGWATRWLPSSLAAWLAVWLERSTGEFHLASKYGKNASCRVEVSTEFRRDMCVSLSPATARVYTYICIEVRRDVSVNRGGGLYLNECRRGRVVRLRQWFPNHPTKSYLFSLSLSLLRDP